METPEQARKAELEAVYGKVYTTAQATDAFEFIGFGSPYAVVKERSTGIKGSLQFDHRPRFYYNFIAS